MSIFDIEHCDVPEVHKDLLLKVQSRLPDEDALYDLAELFKVFGDSRASASSSRPPSTTITCPSTVFSTNDIFCAVPTGSIIRISAPFR